MLSVVVCVGLVAQQLTNVLLPRYIEGLNPSNINRIPFAYRAKISGLAPGGVYRYYNQIVTSAASDSTDGAGNCIFVSARGDFVRTTSPGYTKAGTYGVFSADGTGAYEGWFISEPTGNARFVPGKYVFMRVIMKDSTLLTATAFRRTTSDSVRVVRLSPAAGDTTGTGLRGTSAGSPKDFIFVYDNSAGTGRPISGTFIEGDGTPNTTANSYAGFYSTYVNEVNGAFGMVLPNALLSGIRMVEQRSLLTGKVIVTTSDADGVWESGTNTVNPSGGATALVLSPTDIRQPTFVRTLMTIPGIFSLQQNYPNPFNNATSISFTLSIEKYVKLDVVSILGEHVAVLVHERLSAGSYSVYFVGSDVPSGMYFYRMSTGQFTSVKKMVLSK